MLVEPLQIYIAADEGHYGHLVLCYSSTSVLTIPFTSSGFYNKDIGNNIDNFKLTNIRYKLLITEVGYPKWLPQSIINISQEKISGYVYTLQQIEKISTLNHLMSSILYGFQIILEGGK